jgi:integrative and conjugative element protein (TIGR02256 family)
MNNNALIYVLENGYLAIEDDVIKQLTKYIQHSSSDVEQGGVLIGEYRGNHIRITSSSTPGPDDKASRYSFYRNKKYHNKIIKNEWISSEGYSTYVGEWHTHPENYPTPSIIDMTNWEKNLPPDRPMILLIMGLKGIWCGCKSLKKIKELEID